MKPIQLSCIIFLIQLFSCQEKLKTEIEVKKVTPKQYITILGIAQDAGYPQIDCSKSCCQSYHDGLETRKLVSCLGLVDLESKKNGCLMLHQILQSRLKI
ncbi:hypothetical protein [Hanstruepera flava]|uniref:hypothetical protein n=1 Tax=Hanstruepera flava TaxID=2930218 RepID=UPI002028C7F3|nr:hypothetical protein [Hanstruepera flava]